MRGVVRSVVLVHNNFWPTLGLGAADQPADVRLPGRLGYPGAKSSARRWRIVLNAYLSTGMLLAIFAFYESLSRRAGARRVVGSKT